MRKFAVEKKLNNRIYTNELRQEVANRVDYYLDNSNLSAWAIWHKVGGEFNVSWGSARRYHNAIGNSPRARKGKGLSTNIKPILEQEYSEKLRKFIMKAAMKTSVPQVAKTLGIANSTIYDWIKAYGYSTAYFNRK